MTTNREAGDKFAATIKNYINKRAEFCVVETKNSGATHRNTDLIHSKLCIDCKCSNGTKLPVSLKTSDIVKASDQADAIGRIGVAIVETRDGNMVGMKLDDFIHIVDYYISATDPDNEP